MGRLRLAHGAAAYVPLLVCVREKRLRLRSRNVLQALSFT